MDMDIHVSWVRNVNLDIHVSMDIHVSWVRNVNLCLFVDDGSG